MAHSFSAGMTNNDQLILAEEGENNNFFRQMNEEAEKLKVPRFQYVYHGSSLLFACQAAGWQKEFFRTDLRAMKIAEERGFCRCLQVGFRFRGFLRK